MTYENILNDMLNRVETDVDKREGSIIYDALAPCAYHLAQTYFYLDSLVDLVSGDTAVGEYLDKVVADYGLARKVPTHAKRKIETNGAVEIGTRWGKNEITYKITEQLAENIYSATCEQPGEIGNLYSGALDSIDNVSGVTATLTGVISSGENEESDDELRARFYSMVQSTSTSGNVADYKNWALEVSGVGSAKVFPLWNGAGTVKVLVLDSNMEIDETLEGKVFDYIETVRPIGATVTVDSPSAKTISIKANIKLDGTRKYDEILAEFISSYTSYLESIVFKTYVVSYAKIGSLLLTTSGVADYSDLLINEDTSNIIIGDYEIPVTGSVTLMEVE
ncbi:MAG TPA: baseplate J/gp47 family protein [Clostridiales bacterium]|nr:baseplate J/gp47 family protein [Clostridiales bacterium]